MRVRRCASASACASASVSASASACASASVSVSAGGYDRACERGSISIVVAFGLCLVALLALGVADLSRLADARARTQTAADAAALAALQQMVRPTIAAPSPEEEASRFADANGGTLVACSCVEGSLEASVEVRRSVPVLWLLDDGVWVTASARAVAEPPAPLATPVPVPAPEMALP